MSGKSEHPPEWVVETLKYDVARQIDDFLKVLREYAAAIALTPGKEVCLPPSQVLRLLEEIDRGLHQAQNTAAQVQQMLDARTEHVRADTRAAMLHEREVLETSHALEIANWQGAMEKAIEEITHQMDQRGLSARNQARVLARIRRHCP